MTDAEKNSKDYITITKTLMSMQGDLKVITNNIGIMQKDVGKLDKKFDFLHNELTTNVEKIDGKISAQQVELSNGRVKDQKFESENIALHDKVETIEKIPPICEIRFKKLEDKSSFFSGRVVGIGVAFTAVMSLIAIIIEAVKAFH